MHTKDMGRAEPLEPKRRDGKLRVCTYPPALMVRMERQRGSTFSQGDLIGKTRKIMLNLLEN